MTDWVPAQLFRATRPTSTLSGSSPCCNPGTGGRGAPGDAEADSPGQNGRRSSFAGQEPAQPGQAVALRLVSALLELGNVFVNAGRLEEAVAQYTAALEVAPDDAVMHHNLGVALEGLGRLREAAAEFEEALRLRPDFAQATESLARVKARLVASR